MSDLEKDCAFVIVDRPAVERMFVEHEMKNPAEVARTLAESSWDEDEEEEDDVDPYEDEEFLRSELEAIYRGMQVGDMILRAVDWGLAPAMVERGILARP